MSVKCDRAAWIKGGNISCQNVPTLTIGTFHLVMLGAPGVGKGTIADMMEDRLGICHLSTGDIFRALKNSPPESLSPVMKEALDYMTAGKLVPDEIVIGIVKERIKCLRCSNGFVLDGFPRTLVQAEALDEILAGINTKLDAVINYEMPIEAIVARLSGRRTCQQCQAVYHIVNRPPKKEGVCDVCGGQLIQREDDKPEAIRVRMDIYKISTLPLVDYFKKKNLLITIAADTSAEVMFNDTKQALLSLRKS